MNKLACRTASHRTVGSTLALFAIMLLSVPQALQAQQCDLSLLDNRPSNSGFYFGLGDQTSTNRGLARRMAMTEARGQLALAARPVMVSYWEEGVTERFVDAQLTNIITEGTSYCREGSIWNVLVLLKVDRGAV
jgi:hypothetical protein